MSGNVITGSIQAQLISQGASVNPSTNSASTNSAAPTDTTGSGKSGVEPISFQSRASSLGATLKNGGNVGNAVAADFGSWATAHGVRPSAASFSTFSQQYKAGLESAGLSAGDTDTALSQGQAAIFSGQQVKNFTLGQTQV